MKSIRASLLLSGLAFASAVLCGQTPRPAPPKTAPMQTGVLLLHGSEAASLFIDGQRAGDLEAGAFLKISEVAGEHFVEAREKAGICKWEKKVAVPAGMQVAESVDFESACPSKAGVYPAVPSPASVAPAEAVDPKIQEAIKLHERGSLLHALGRDSEAVPLLEKAAALKPDIDPHWLDVARHRVAFSQRELAECESREGPTASDKGQKKTEGYSEHCIGRNAISAYHLGYYSGSFTTINSTIQARSDQLDSISAKLLYEQRALLEYAMGNAAAALRDLQTALDWYQKDPSGQEENVYFYRAVIQADLGNVEAASQDCRTAHTFRLNVHDAFNPFAEFCAHLVTPPAAQDSGQPVNSPPPATVALPPIVDPKTQEARDLYEHGCRLHFLELDSEAVPLLEKAARLLPSENQEYGCLDSARSELNAAKEIIRACENPPTPSKPDKNQGNRKAENRDCRATRMSAGYTVGDLGGFSLANYLVQASERDQNFLALSVGYMTRAIYEYALGNPTDALRDLQAALDSVHRAQYPGLSMEQAEMTIDNSEAGIYFKRAVIQMEIGNIDAAGQDCRILLTSKSLKRFIGQDVLGFCTRLVTSTPAPNNGESGNNSSVSQGRSIDDAIGRIRGGQYSPMPPPQVFATGGAGSPKLTIENSTQYELHVYLSGPETRSISIPAGGTSVLDFQPGTFKLAAEIPNSSIIPFYGEQTFNNGTAYVEKFYIQRVQ